MASLRGQKRPIHTLPSLPITVLQPGILRLSVLHDVPLTVCDVDQEPVTQRRYCDPVKRRQASQKLPIASGMKPAVLVV
ncbi:hypothetical protein N9L74_07505 [Luminiphilus sp.]|nr:hypothetical protein [Luminiphilus sp.]